ncbi:ABC transporter substrate-binding protein, partial [Salmonella enterica]|uniref:ABC transporter substrate-binding protein n=1 Tax=Salmonella enterica TaxID=28901 RepID=UPI003D26866C
KIIPAAIAKGGLDRLNREAVDTGPFKLVTFEPERIIVVARNPAYYDPARPVVDKVEVVVYPDMTAQGSALISSDIDLMYMVAP